MPVLATMGIKALYYKKWGANDTDRSKVPTTGMTPVDVYQDTCSFVDKDATLTEHKSETSSKKIVMKTKEGSDLVFYHGSEQAGACRL